MIFMRSEECALSTMLINCRGNLNTSCDVMSSYECVFKQNCSTVAECSIFVRKCQNPVSGNVFGDK